MDLDLDLNQARRGRKQGTPDDDDGNGGRVVRGVRMYLCERAMATRRRMATAPHLPAASVFVTCPVGGCAAQHRGERARPISFHSSGPLPPLIWADRPSRHPWSAVTTEPAPLARQWKLPNLWKLNTPLFAVSTSSGARKGASNGGDGGPSLPVPLVPMRPRVALCAAGRVMVDGAKEARPPCGVARRQDGRSGRHPIPMQRRSVERASAAVLAPRCSLLSTRVPARPGGGLQGSSSLRAQAQAPLFPPCRLGPSPGSPRPRGAQMDA